MFLKVRIHECNDRVSRDGVCRYFSEFDGAVFVVYETEANRPHYQGIVWWSKTIDTLRKQIKSRFAVSGNEQYGVEKVKDYDAHTRYLGKGPTKKRGVLPDVVVKQAIDIDVEVKHNEFWEENERLKERGKREGSKSVIETVMQRVKALDCKGMSGRREVAREVIEVLKERNSAINMFHARGVFNAVMMRIDTGFQESFIDEIISKY